MKTSWQICNKDSLLRIRIPTSLIFTQFISLFVIQYLFLSVVRFGKMLTFVRLIVQHTYESVFRKSFIENVVVFNVRGQRAALILV